jgi:excinuclease UvrABC ATPase subunit
MTLFGRVSKLTGLLGKARALFHGLGPKGEYPSRKEKGVCLWCDGMGMLWTDASMSRAISCSGCDGSGWKRDSAA